MLRALATTLRDLFAEPRSLEALAADPQVASALARTQQELGAQVRALCDQMGELGTPANPHIKAIGGFQVHRELGRGNMGSVYLATNDQAQQVVIKVPFSEYGTAQQYVEIFFREFAALSTLRHENIVRVYRFGRDPTHNVYYYVAEFVNGVNLKQFLEAHPEQRFTPVQAAAVMLSTLRAIRFLRSKNITHRDLKPGNLMIDREGGVKLIDFGAAKIAGETSELTHAGVVMGTFDYMAPEAGRRDAEASVGAERDIFALGIMHYRLLKGRLPNEFGSGQEAAVAFARFCDSRRRPLRDVSGIDPRSRSLLLRLTERNPKKRLVGFDEIERRLLEIVKEA